MEHAGKRGKRCRTLRISGAPWTDTGNDSPRDAAARWTWQLMHRLQKLAPDVATQPHRAPRFIVPLPFEQAADIVRQTIEEARAEGVPDGYLQAYDEEIRGIDAPRPVLSAGIAGKWSATADEDGLHLADLADAMNEPRMINTRQTDAEAYRLAAKVWHLLARARTMHEAADILTAAGCRLHYYCAMD
jgi:hypothetical protein